MDSLLLEYEMKKKGFNTSTLADKIGISKSAMYCKMAGKTDFTLSEIQRIVKLLELQNPDQIFFGSEVS